MKAPFTIIILSMFSVANLFAQKRAVQLQWRVAGELPSSDNVSSIGVAGPVAGIHQDMLFIGGGANFPDKMPWEGGAKKYHDRLHLFCKNGKELETVEGMFSLPNPIAYSATCSTPLGVFYAGGENEAGLSKKSFLVQGNKSTRSVKLIRLPDLPLALTNASAVSVDHLVYLVGGEIVGGVSAKGWVLNLQALEMGWKEIASLPNAISHTVLVSDGKDDLYVLGGRQKTPEGISELFASVYRYSLADARWKEMPSLPYALSAGTGVFWKGKGVLLFGGDKGTTFSKVEALIVAIGKASGAEKDELIRQKNALQIGHPGFSTEVLFYDITSGESRPFGNILFPTPVTTAAFWWKDAVLIPSGEVKAGVRTPKILEARF